MGMDRGIRALVAALAALAVAPAAAGAEHDRNVPGGLSQSVSTAHFVVHYDPAASPPAGTGMTIAQYAQAGAGDFEESYSRLVSGGGGTPNAGLRAPTADADSKTDVYLAAPTTRPGFSGGTVHGDTHGAASSYVFMTPDLGRDGFRFRAAHEFMHVIQDAYRFRVGDEILEGFANWAADFALPDVDPLDNNFNAAENAFGPAPSNPLDCTFAPWEGRTCGNGYWQWLFVQRQVEAYGADFVSDYYERFRTSGGSVVTLLDATIKAQSANASDLRRRFASYALDVWEPSRWQTTAVQEIHAFFGQPSSIRVTAATPDTGNLATTVDHLATKYLRIVNDGGFEPTGPDDELQVTVERPAGLAAPSNYLTRYAGDPDLTETTGPSGAGTGSIGMTFDPAGARELILPLTNDTTATDDLPFGYRVRYVRGTPTPPANDTAAGAERARLGQDASTETVYAGGRGSDETPGTGCDANLGNSTRGVWYRFTAPASGQYAFDARDSDFPAAIALYETAGGAFGGCSTISEQFSGHLSAGQEMDVYVGRQAGRVLTGSQAKLRITGPPGPAPETTITGGPADGASVDRAGTTFEFSGTGSFPTFECRVDGAAFAACNSPRNLGRLAPGDHTFEVRAVAGGATDPSPAARTFTVRRPPNDDLANAIRLNRAGGSVTGQNETATAEAGEPAHGGISAGASVWYRWRAQGEGDATVETCTNDPGTFDTTLAVYAGSGIGSLTRLAENDDACGPTGRLSRTSFFAEEGGVYWIAVDGYVGGGGFGKTRFMRAIGDYRLTITGPPDTLPPTAAIDSGPSGLSANRNPTFGLSADEDAYTLWCQLHDGRNPASWAECPASHTLSGLQDGDYTLEVRAADAAMNVGPSVTRSWSVDATAPAASITGGPNAETAAREATFTYASNDATASFECSLDAAPFAPCPPDGSAYSGLADGAHTFRVRAVDPAGNAGGADSRSWTIAQPSGGGGAGDPGGGGGTVSPPANPLEPPDTDPGSDAACEGAKAKLARAKAKLKRAKSKAAKKRAKAKVKKAKQAVAAACA